MLLKAGSFLQSAPGEKKRLLTHKEVHPSPLPLPQFEMTAGRSESVPVSLSSWGSCQTAWKGSLKAAQDDWALKGCGEWSQVTCICQGEIPTPRTQCWRAGEAASWRGRKERHKTQWALSEASLGNLMFSVRRHRGKHVEHSTATCKEMGKGWEKGSMTDVAALQNTKVGYMNIAPLRKGSERLEARGWTQRDIQLSSESLEKKKKIRRTRCIKVPSQITESMSLL